MDQPYLSMRVDTSLFSSKLPRYWVTIVRAFPEKIASMEAELSPHGEYVKYEDLQQLLKADA